MAGAVSFNSLPRCAAVVIDAILIFGYGIRLFPEPLSCIFLKGRTQEASVAR